MKKEYYIFLLLTTVSVLKMNSQNCDDIPLELKYKIEAGIYLNVDTASKFILLEDELKNRPESCWLNGLLIYAYVVFGERNTALKIYNDFTEKNPGFKNNNYIVFANAMLQNDIIIKEKLLKQCVTDSIKDNCWAYMELYSLLLQNKKNKEASDIIELAYRYNSKSPAVLIEKINLDIIKEDFFHAQTIADTLIRYYPTYPVLHNYKGYLYTLEKKYDNALEMYNNTLKIDSLNIDALIGVGYIYEATGDISKALTTYNTALKINDKDAQVLKSIGMLYSKNEKYEDAKKYLFEALNINLDYDLYVELIFVLINLKELSSANAYTSEAIKIYGHDFNIDYFEILLNHLLLNYSKSSALTSSYRLKYTKEEYKWLKKQLEYMDIKIEE